jgi:hypothetical protein
MACAFTGNILFSRMRELTKRDDSLRHLKAQRVPKHMNPRVLTYGQPIDLIVRRTETPYCIILAHEYNGILLMYFT